MRGRVQPVDEPRVLAHRRRDAERQVLGELEGLEVVEDDRLDEPAPEVLESPGHEQQGMPAQPGAQAGDGGRRAAEVPGQLPMRRAGLKARCDRDDQLGTLQVIGQPEALSRKGATAGGATEPRHGASSGTKGPVTHEPIPGAAPSMVAALRPWAEGRREVLQTLNGGPGPVHAARRIKPRAYVMMCATA